MKTQCSCFKCHKIFFRVPSRVSASKRLFCSRECTLNTPEEKKKMQKRCIKKWASENVELRRGITRDWRRNNPEKLKISRDKRRHNNRESVILSGIKQSAKKKNIPCNITKEWIKERLNSGCEISGLPFDIHGKAAPESPSVDRINPHGGYTVENCRMILWCINRALFIYGEDYMMEIFGKCIEKRSIINKKMTQKG